MLIYHISAYSFWETAQKIGEYRAESLSVEGFIHCSTKMQVVPVANAFYSGQKDLVLLVIDTEKLDAPLRWEPPAHPNPAKAPKSDGEKFPHLYGVLNLDAVVETRELLPNADHLFTFPEAKN